MPGSIKKALENKDANADKWVPPKVVPEKPNVAEPTGTPKMKLEMQKLNENIKDEPIED
jgi:hypothetical protein